MLYWLVDFKDLTNLIRSMLIKPGVSLATNPVRIVRIDSVPVLHVGCCAGSELELRGKGGGGIKDFLVNFDTTDSRFDLHCLKYGEIPP